jgi:hypothetical protein
VREIRRELRERMRDILAYLRALRFIERAGGTVKLQSSRDSMAIDLATVHVMKAGVFLHLYNLVESTVTTGLEHVAEQIKSTKTPFADLSDSWRWAWAASHARLDENLSPDNQLLGALKLCQAVADGDVIEIKPKLNTGNLDDRRIEELAKKFGIPLAMPVGLNTKVKRRVHNDLGCLGLVRTRRNGLAHGNDSFADTGSNYSIVDLTEWAWATYQYLKAILACFESYVAAQGYRRPPAPPGVP